METLKCWVCGADLELIATSGRYVQKGRPTASPYLREGKPVCSQACAIGSIAHLLRKLEAFEGLLEAAINANLWLSDTPKGTDQRERSDKLAKAIAKAEGMETP